MLRMMNETRESLKFTFRSWTAEALNFVERTADLRPRDLRLDELCRVSAMLVHLSRWLTMTSTTSSVIYAGRPPWHLSAS